MNIVIIEDEKPAAGKLQRHLKKFDSNINILAVIASVKNAIPWIKESGEKADLYFLDVQLADGLCFEIFEHVEINKPIIFTTAFNQYAIEAFKVNGLDYLLKPVTYEKLTESIHKIERLKSNLGRQESAPLNDLNKILSKLKDQTYKNRFMVKVGEHIKSIIADDITLFFAEGRTAYLVTKQERKFIIDYKLESLEEMLDPNLFFRVNRSFIVKISAIRDVLVYSNSRLKISVDPEFPKEIIVSREKVNAFKDWFNGMK